MAKLWSYSTGTRGVNAVRVYERRRPGSPLQIEWYVDGVRQQRTLKHSTGYKIVDKEQAKKIAHEMAQALEQGHNKKVAEGLYGVSPGKTTSDLFARLHEAKERKWRPTYAKDQARFRKFWLERLGKDARLVSITPAIIEQCIHRHLKDRRPATRNRYRRYIVDAFNYAERKLKWIDPHHNLSGVDFEDPDHVSEAYSREEVPRLLEALEKVDIRAGWIGHVCWQTGRRLTAVRTLPKKCVEVGQGVTKISFPQETDKAGKRGDGAIVGHAHELSVKLIPKAGRYMLGESAPSLDLCESWIRQAEEIAGIPHVKHRGWHGLKRRFSTSTKGMKGRDKQAGTLESTLRLRYEQDDDFDAKIEVARELDRLASAG